MSADVWYRSRCCRECDSGCVWVLIDTFHKMNDSSVDAGWKISEIYITWRLKDWNFYRDIFVKQNDDGWRAFIKNDLTIWECIFQRPLIVITDFDMKLLTIELLLLIRSAPITFVHTNSYAHAEIFSPLLETGSPQLIINDC